MRAGDGPRLGIVGGGQLGRMLALAALNLGVRCRVYDEHEGAVAGHAAELVVGPFEGAAAALLDRFTAGLEAVTYEFENVPVPLARALEARVPVRPGPAALEASQDRVTEKTLLRSLGVRTAEFAAVDGAAELRSAVERVGLPLILKTRRGGYDGKGQVMVRKAEELEGAMRELATATAKGGAGLIAEGVVPFVRELSIVAVRGMDGACVFYPLAENHHAGGILRLSLAPAPGVSASVQREAESIARRVLEELKYVGVLCVELFELPGGELVANEMAPRVHNSGHWTMDFAETGQFENHVRAVLGMPLGSTGVMGCGDAGMPACAMVNLIGAIPEAVRERALRMAGARLHDYGKAPRPGRKVGHVNLWAADGERLAGLIAGVRVDGIK